MLHQCAICCVNVIYYVTNYDHQYAKKIFGGWKYLGVEWSITCDEKNQYKTVNFL